MNSKPNPSYEDYNKFIEDIKNFNVDELESLISNPDVNIRKEVAMNGNLSNLQFFRLAADESADVRCAVTTNQEVPKEVLILLIPDREWEVRWNVAMSDNATIEILRLLVEDPNEVVREVAQKHIKHLAEKN